MSGEQDDGGRGIGGAAFDLFDLTGEFEAINRFAVKVGVGEGDIHEHQIDGAGTDDIEDGVAIFLKDGVDAAGEAEDVG